MARGRAYIRVLPESFARKAFGVRDATGKLVREPYPPAAVAAFYGLLCLTEDQPWRGRFASLGVVRALLEGPGRQGVAYGRQVAYLVAHRDLVVQADGSVYVDGWDELQEGDIEVNTRMRRYRDRRRSVTPDVTGSVTPDVTATVTPDVTATVTPDPSIEITLSDSLERLAENNGRLTGRRNAADPGAPAETEPNWFDPAAAGPEAEAIAWLAAHHATVEPNGRGFHPKLAEVAGRHGSAAVITALEEAARRGAKTARQLVFALDDILDPPIAVPRPRAETPAERELREMQERQAARLAARGAPA